MENQKNISSMTLALLMFMTVFGITNIANNYGNYGNSAIGWFILLAIFFIPLALMIAELASYDTTNNSGLKGWVKYGTNDMWSFIAVWCYFVANIFYLPMLASRVPVFLSWLTADFESLQEVVDSGGAIEGVVTATSDPRLFLIMALITILVAIVCALFFERIFDKLGTIVGYMSLGITIFFIVMALLTVPVLGNAIANPIVIGGDPSQSIMPDINAASLSTFAWILFAIAGIETVGNYVGRIQNPEKKLPRGILMAAVISIGLYIVGFIAMSFILVPDQVPVDLAMENLLPIMFAQVGAYWGFGPMFLKVVMLIFSIITFTALVLWLVATVSFLFEDFPKGILSDKIVDHRTNNLPTFGLFLTGALIVVFLIISSTSGDGSNIYVTLYDMSTIACILPYLILSASYIGFKRRNLVSSYQVSKNKNVSIAIGCFVFTVSAIAVIFSTIDLSYGDMQATKEWFIYAAGGLGFFISIGLALYSRQKSNVLSYAIFTIVFALASFLFAPTEQLVSPMFLIITIIFAVMLGLSSVKGKKEVK